MSFVRDRSARRRRLGARPGQHHAPAERIGAPARDPLERRRNSISLAGGAGLGLGGTVPLASSIAGFFPAANIVYDTAVFHVEGILGFRSQPNPRNRSFQRLGLRRGRLVSLAPRLLQRLLGRRASSSINYASNPGGSATLTAFEPGALVRAFLTPNVALFARGGLAILLGDSAPGGGTNFYFGSQPTLVAGFTYFFR